MASIGKAASRAISWSAAAARWLCTAAAPAAADAGSKVAWKPLYRRLSALGADPSGSVAATMEGWLGEKRVVSEPDLLSYVRELRRYKKHKHALELMEWMEARGETFSAGRHAIRLNLLSKVKGIDAAECYFSNLPDSAKKQKTYSAMLSCYVDSKMTEKAMALYEKMDELGFTSSSLIQNVLMTLYMKSGQPEKVPDIFSKMQANGTSPDSFSYCILMKSCASMNDMESTERVVQEMEGSGTCAHWTIYSNLAAHYNSVGLFKKAESALKKVEELMGKRDLTPFHFLISLYAGAGNLPEVKRVWKLVKETFAWPTNKSYLIMLQALSRLDDIESLRQCFEEWESVHKAYDKRLAAVTIRALLRKDMVSEAETVWEKAAAKGFSSPRTLNLFVNDLLNFRQMDLAFKCFQFAIKQAKKDAWKPDTKMIDRFLKYFEETKDVNAMESLCKNLKKFNFLDAQAYESLFRTYLAAGKTDPSLVQRIEEDGIEMRPEKMELLKLASTS